MSVRTYGRRNRGSIPNGAFSVDALNDAVHDSQEDTPSQDHHNLCGIPFSSQESSSHFEFDPYGLDFSSQGSFRDDDSLPNAAVPKPKKPKVSRNLARPPAIPATATLMEAQEFGEMMEHVDEVNFALDGLRRNQPVRIRRASLLSLLSICGTAQQRRLLRAQG